MLAALAPGGLLGVIDRIPSEEKESRSAYTSSHVIPEDTVKSEIEAGGFEFVRREDFIQPSPRGFQQFFLVFRKKS
jgi:predicted methyltransferase